jgi:hypothetical protein
MRLARFPNVQGPVPTSADWTKISKVARNPLDADGGVLTLRDVTLGQLEAWAKELAAGVDVWTHGLWAWNWADSHRPVTNVSAAAGTIAVARDDIDRDVNPIKSGGGAQGGNMYARCAFSDRDLLSRMPLDLTHVRLKLLHACHQWHSSRKPLSYQLTL